MIINRLIDFILYKVVPPPQISILVDKPKDLTPWLSFAKTQESISEKFNQETIKSYLLLVFNSKDTYLINAKTAWCAAFICYCLEEAGIKSPKTAWARAFLNYGTKLEKPKFGCIVVLTRGDDSGHVGFYIAEGLFTVTIFGGNQDDSVCLKKYPKSRVLGYRWPL